METHHYTLADIPSFPEQPGVYLFYNKKQEVIYVGKAKNLKKRVGSYFNKQQTDHPKTQRLVALIHSIGFTLVHTEYDALLLENNLIKNFQPRYNILLKDDKSYPYICVTQEPFPRIIPIRQRIYKDATYYGPFIDSKIMYQMIELIHLLYPIRSCAYNLTPDNIAKKKFKVCLEYHIGRCQGPCQNLQTESAYKQDINQIHLLLKGHLSKVKKNLKEKMHQAAQAMDYKMAQQYKEKIIALENYQSKSLIVTPSLGDLDVLAILSDEKNTFVSYLQIREGAIIFTDHAICKKSVEENDEEILPLMILQFREKYTSTAPEIVLNKPIDTSFGALTITVPKIGDKKKLVDLAIKNAFFLQKRSLLQRHENQVKAQRPLALLQEALQLTELPHHIECFDNSNIQGAHPVGAVVVFKEGKPVPKEYRHFHIKTVIGADDFASMKEIVGRRYQRLLQENSSLPQLIVIDGGKGQLNAAVEILKNLGLYGKIAIIGLAKRLEEIYYPSQSEPLQLNKQSPALRLLQQIRNEAHRFAITFHRNKRSKTSLHSKLTTIPGIGEKTTSKLLNHFGSLQRIQTASIEELIAHIGQKKATLLKENLS